MTPDTNENKKVYQVVSIDSDSVFKEYDTRIHAQLAVDTLNKNAGAERYRLKIVLKK